MKIWTHYLLRRLMLSALLAAFCGYALGQQAAKLHPARTGSRKAISYAFVSPNTRENLTLQEAIAGLDSAEEKRLIREARQVVCRLHLASRARRALGSWTDGAENSTALRVRSDQLTVRYAASWLEKFARQKTVLYFHQRRLGAARMYLLFLPRRDWDMAAIATELDSDGVANRTLVPGKKGMLVYIVDLKNELKDQVLKAARRLHARLSSLGGDGEFIGDDNDRDRARAIFEQEIASYEHAHIGVRRPCKKKIASTGY